MKFIAPLTDYVGLEPGETCFSVEFDLGTPEPTEQPTYAKKGWIARKLCSHSFEPLGERVGIYFHQERMAWAYHYVCSKCGETDTIETDSMTRPNL